MSVLQKNIHKNLFIVHLKSSGIIIFSLGIFFLVEDERSSLFKLFAVEKYNYSLLQFLAWSFVAIGSAKFVIGFAGCCGAVKENRWLLIIVRMILVLFNYLFNIFYLFI